MITAFHSATPGQRVSAARVAAHPHRWGYRTLSVEAAGGHAPASYSEPGAGALNLLAER